MNKPEVPTPEHSHHQLASKAFALIKSFALSKYSEFGRIIAEVPFDKNIPDVREIYDQTFPLSVLGSQAIRYAELFELKPTAKIYLSYSPIYIDGPEKYYPARTSVFFTHHDQSIFNSSGYIIEAATPEFRASKECEFIQMPAEKRSYSHVEAYGSEQTDDFIEWSRELMNREASVQELQNLIPLLEAIDPT